MYSEDNSQHVNEPTESTQRWSDSNTKRYQEQGASNDSTQQGLWKQKIQFKVYPDIKTAAEIQSRPPLPITHYYQFYNGYPISDNLCLFMYYCILLNSFVYDKYVNCFGARKEIVFLWKYKLNNSLLDESLCIIILIVFVKTIT